MASSTSVTDPPATNPQASSSPTQREETHQEKLLKLLIISFIGALEAYYEGGNASSHEAYLYREAIHNCVSELRDDDLITEWEVMVLLLNSIQAEKGIDSDITNEINVSQFIDDLTEIGALYASFLKDIAHGNPEIWEGNIMTLVRGYLATTLPEGEKDEKVMAMSGIVCDMLTYYETVLQCRDLTVNERRTRLGELPDQTRIRLAKFRSQIEVGIIDIVRKHLLGMRGMDMLNLPPTIEKAAIDSLCVRVQLNLEEINVKHLMRLL